MVNRVYLFTLQWKSNIHILCTIYTWLLLSSSLILFPAGRGDGYSIHSGIPIIGTDNRILVHSPNGVGARQRLQQPVSLQSTSHNESHFHISWLISFASDRLRLPRAPAFAQRPVVIGQRSKRGVPQLAVDEEHN